MWIILMEQYIIHQGAKRRFYFSREMRRDAASQFPERSKDVSPHGVYTAFYYTHISKQEVFIPMETHEESRIQVDVDKVCLCMSQSESTNNSKYLENSGNSQDKNIVTWFKRAEKLGFCLGRSGICLVRPPPEGRILTVLMRV